MKELFDSMKKFYDEIDEKAKIIAKMYCENKKITHEILNIIIDFYKLEGEIKDKFIEYELFNMAYHEPITSKLEFFLARIFYHISKEKELKWKIYLRKQKERCAPDIRVECNGKNIFILEIKAKAGYIQPFISPEAYKKDKEKGLKPEKLVKKQKEQLLKYKKTFKTDKIYMLLPTLQSAHQKNYPTTYDDYKNFFKKNTDLPKNNFVILSKDLGLDLSWGKIEKNDIKKERLTDEFEEMLNTIL